MDVKPEACVNVWLIVDQDTELIYRAAARAYMIAGTDEDKARVLKDLAQSDYHLASHFSLSRYKTTVVDVQGRTHELSGLFNRDLNVLLPDIMETICKGLEQQFTEQVKVTSSGKKCYKMKIPEEPYYVLTFLFEDDAGTITPRLT